MILKVFRSFPLNFIKGSILDQTKFGWIKRSRFTDVDSSLALPISQCKFCVDKQWLLDLVICLQLPVKSSISSCWRIGNHVRVKSSGVAPGYPNARPPARSPKICINIQLKRKKKVAASKKLVSFTYAIVKLQYDICSVTIRKQGLCTAWEPPTCINCSTVAFIFEICRLSGHISTLFSFFGF